MSAASNTERVRVRNTAKSTLRGQILNVVEIRRWQGSNELSYLCEMPGWPQPGWFSQCEVDRA